jgi:pantetheine-phosphate adenylyltransferase
VSGDALIGIYPGSFDPVHLGHVDLVRRARRIAGRLVVAVLDNPEKTSLFSVDERLALLRESFRGMEGVEVDTFRGLLVDFCHERRASVVFRGLRAVSDFEYEFQMALMNRHLAPDVETVFLAPSENCTFLSSRLVKEAARLGGDVSGLVPPHVAAALRAVPRPEA